MNVKLTLLFVSGLLIAFPPSVIGGNLVVRHNGTTVWSVNEYGQISFVKNVVEKSATPVDSAGLILNRSSGNMLWTANSDQVNIKGQFMEPIADTSRWLMFRKIATGKRAALTDSGNIPTAGDEQNLVREDIYLDDHIIQNDISGGSIIEYCNFGDGRVEYQKHGDTTIVNKYFPKSVNKNMAKRLIFG